MAVTFPGVCAVVPAAGFGRRMQTDCPKQYLSIGNKTILEHSVDALLAHARVQRVIIAVSAGDERFAQLPLAQHPQITVVAGGAARADSAPAQLKRNQPGWRYSGRAGARYHEARRAGESRDCAHRRS